MCSAAHSDQPHAGTASKAGGESAPRILAHFGGDRAEVIRGALEMDQRDNCGAFARWLQKSQLSIRKASCVLGCSTTSVINWKRRGAPLYILLACAAWSYGLPPIE